jgi:hypothetical protein
MRMIRKHENDWSRPLVVPMLLAAVTCAVVTLYHFDPALSGFYPLTQFHGNIGLLFPAGASLTALHQLLHGRFLHALSLNPVLLVMLPCLLYLFVSYVSPVLFRRNVVQRFLSLR